MRKSLNIIEKQSTKRAETMRKRLDVTTAEEKINAGQMSDSEKMIAAEMRRYMNDVQKQFELITNMKKSNNETEETKRQEITTEKKSFFKRLINKIVSSLVKFC